MTARLTLICCGATAATRRASFPDDEPLEPGAVAGPETAPRSAAALTSPALRARQTAEALSLDARIDPALRDCAYGAWAGRTLAEVEAADPDGLAAWLSDPEAAPHGGESVAEVIRRVSAWLDGRLAGRGRIVAVTHPAVIRAALLHVLDAPAHAVRRIDVPPLARVDFTTDGRRWNFRTDA